jgi:predicted transcriptional regulator
MDRILSARISDKIVKQINNLSQKMHTSKKAVIEKAIELLGRKLESEQGLDVFDQTCGAWNRKESAADIVKQAKTAFRKSMHRYEQ